MNKAIFLDRDGTINVDTGYVYKIEEFQFIDGVISAIKALSDAGFLIIVITNQSGIARGFYTEEDFEKVTEYMKSVVPITAVYHCPHLYENCNCRKPKTGLFYQAAKEWNIDFSKSYVIGDSERDLCICDAEPVKGFLIGKDFDNVLEIANKILNEQVD